MIYNNELLKKLHMNPMDHSVAQQGRYCSEQTMTPLQGRTQVGALGAAAPSLFIDYLKRLFVVIVRHHVSLSSDTTLSSDTIH